MATNHPTRLIVMSTATHCQSKFIKTHLIAIEEPPKLLAPFDAHTTAIA